MKIEDIIDKWRTDAKVDDTELDREALNVPFLHAKYLTILSEERLKLRSMKLKIKEMTRLLGEYYRGDLNTLRILLILGESHGQRLC